MEVSLCKEMGEKTQPYSKSQVPSEEELKKFLQQVEALEHTLVSWCIRVSVQCMKCGIFPGQASAETPYNEGACAGTDHTYGDGVGRGIWNICRED